MIEHQFILSREEQMNSYTYQEDMIRLLGRWDQKAGNSTLLPHGLPPGLTGHSTKPEASAATQK